MTADKAPARARRAGPSSFRLPNRFVGLGSFAFEGIQVRNALPKLRLPEAGARRLLGHYLRKLGLPGASLSLLVCGDAQSRRLNKAFRGKDQPTDVLSFPALPGRPPRNFKGHLGDIALDLPYARRHMGRFVPTLEGELAFLLLHGLLHLCGHHHDNATQERALWRLKRRLFPPPKPLLKGLSA